MPLKLTRKQPKARRIELDAGSDVEPKRPPVALWIRPATYPEAIEASERIAPMIVALREGSAAALEIAVLLGDEFADAIFDDAKLAAAARKLAEMELVALCFERMDGVLLDDDDQPFDTVDGAVASLLLRDPIIAHKLRAVIEGPIHEVVAEKNGSAASPSGAAATPDTASDAAKPELPAPPAAAE